ncbi:MAG: chorismate synthase [Muribaculaceae bacterium]|nr:chorismate synthase [Muribaculaceae bacterium]
MNSFGRRYRLTSFGESHGPAIGGVIDGIEPGLAIDLGAVQAELDRRRPGQSTLTTARLEADRLEVLSGVFEGKTLGTPIGFIVRNADQRPGDYDRHALRPSHADYTYLAKYGIRDHRGGGRASARETIARVVAGAFARQALALRGISVHTYVSQVGAVTCDKPYASLDLSLTDTNPVRCPDPEVAARMEAEIRSVQSQGDTLGGVATCVIAGVPAGLGEPVFGKLQSQLAAAMLSINAAKGFDYGMGFDGASGRGSELNDAWRPGFKTATNHSGGIQGGISNGQDIYFRVAFKPVATLMRDIETIDDQGRPVTLPARGRHDPCVLPRAVPIVEAMALMVIYDSLLSQTMSASVPRT